MTRQDQDGPGAGESKSGAPGGSAAGDGPTPGTPGTPAAGRPAAPRTTLRSAVPPAVGPSAAGAAGAAPAQAPGGAQPGGGQPGGATVRPGAAGTTGTGNTSAGPGTATQAGSGATTPTGATTQAGPGAATLAGPGEAGTAKAGSGTAERPDGWASFGPAPERPPTRVGRALRVAGRVLSHEYTLATIGSVLLAVVMTWPTLRYPLHTIPQDIWDPTLQAWQMAWSGHALLTDPANLWHSNTFFPERYSFAFSDSLLGYAPAGLIGTGPEAALLRYNIMFVLAHALAVLGPYALVRQLGAGRIGAAVAAAAFAYAPWRLAQEGHLHVISSGGIPLAFAMLARGHGWSLRHGYRPERRHAGWALAGWLVAAWQISLGFGIGLPFGYALLLVVVVAAVGWAVRRIVLRRPKQPFGRRLLLTDLAGGLVFAAVGLLIALPYFKVVELHPYAQRSVESLKLFSPPAGSFLIAPAESRIWGAAHEQARAGLGWVPEMTLLPGFVLYALALGGLLYSVWTVRQRLLLLAGVLGTAVLSMGTSFLGGRFSYLPLFDHLPGWNGIRTPGRLVLWTTLFLGVLAAGAVTEFARRARDVSDDRGPSRPSGWLRVATLVPLALVLVEGLNLTPHPIVPLQPAAMRAVDGPVLVLPSDDPWDMHVMLWSTDRFQQVVNGSSGFTPQRLTQTRDAVQTFPDQNSISYLRGLGVKTVVLQRSRVAGTPWESTVDLPVDTLGIQREDVGETVVFRL